MHGAGFVGRVPGVSHHAEIGLGESTRQLPGAAQRTHHVVAALNDHGRDVTEARHVVEQLVFMREKAAVHEVVTLDAREREAELVPRAAANVLFVLQQVTGAGFPHAPRARGLLAREGVLRGEPAMVGGDQITALRERDHREVLLPGVGEQQARPVLIEPLQLPTPQQEDAAQHELTHPRRVRLGVRQRERAAPRSAEHQPALDAEVLTQRLDVRDQMPSRVVDQRCMRLALAAAALIEEHDAVALRVEEAALLGTGTTAGAAVQEHHRFAAGVARLLEVQGMFGGYLEVAGSVGLDLRVKGAPRHGQGDQGTRLGGASQACRRVLGRARWPAT